MILSAGNTDPVERRHYAGLEFVRWDLRSRTSVERFDGRRLYGKADDLTQQRDLDGSHLPDGAILHRVAVLRRPGGNGLSSRMSSWRLAIWPTIQRSLIWTTPTIFNFSRPLIILSSTAVDDVRRHERCGGTCGTFRGDGLGEVSGLNAGNDPGAHGSLCGMDARRCCAVYRRARDRRLQELFGVLVTVFRTCGGFSPQSRQFAYTSPLTKSLSPDSVTTSKIRDGLRRWR